MSYVPVEGIERETVSSSNVKEMGYDPDTETLEVEFHKGLVYQYTGVPEDTYKEVRSAPSVGGALAHKVKGIYPHHEVKVKAG